MRGRPVGSKIRENICLILNKINFSYGYEIYKIYKQVFGKVLLRDIYYHLKKGNEIGEFIAIEAKKELGRYTWGDQAERIYYALGPFANFETNDKIEQRLSIFKEKNIEVNWLNEINKRISVINEEIEKVNNQKLPYLAKKGIQESLIKRIEKLKKWAENKVQKEKVLEIEELRKKALLIILR
jgi:uncharacterized small protein (DUF1192 family)